MLTAVLHIVTLRMLDILFKCETSRICLVVADPYNIMSASIQVLSISLDLDEFQITYKAQIYLGATFGPDTGNGFK